MCTRHGTYEAIFILNSTVYESKKEGKDQESMQSSTTPDPGYQWESDNVTIRQHKRDVGILAFISRVNTTSKGKNPF